MFLLISVVGGAFISIKSLSRIDSIITKTKYITTQNLEEKISGDEFDDEYGRLTRTMNEMISRIKKSIDYMNQFSISNISLGKCNGTKAMISVEDKGEYIPAELYQKIFERFFRIESSRNRNTGGAGLGLAVVKSIVELHGGQIEVKSLENGITTFNVIL